MRYCQHCDRSYDDDYTFCPRCSARLLSQAEAENLIRTKEKEAIEKRNQEEQADRVAAMCKSIYPILEKFASKGIYNDIDSSRDLRDAIADGNRYNRISYSTLCEIYETVVVRKKSKKEELIHALYRKFSTIEDKLSKLNDLINSNYSARINPNRYFRYGDFERAWLRGGRGELVVECRDRSGQGYTLCYYDIEQYAFDWGMKDRFGHLPHEDADFVPKYYMFKREIDLICGRLDSEISSVEGYLRANYNRYDKMYVFPPYSVKTLLETFKNHGVCSFVSKRKEERNHD